MPFYFSWGMTFLAIYGEFWPWQIAQIRIRAEELFERRPQDDDLECAAQIRASIIPFEMYGYGLVLVLREDVWTLEVASFPPHAEPGERIRRARRLRERKQRKQASDAAKSKKQGNKRAHGSRPAERALSTAKNAFSLFLSNLYNIGRAACAVLEQLRPKLAVFLAHLELAIPASPMTVRQEVLRWLAPSREDCRAANIAAWVQKPLPRGFQRERRLFFSEFLPIWLDTIAPIEPIFVRGGRSIFGELFRESEYVS